MSARGNRADRQAAFFEDRYAPGKGDYLAIHRIALTRLHHEVALSLLPEAGPVARGGPVADIGCACGDFTARLAKALPGALCIGTDFVERGLHEAQARYPALPVLRAALPDLPFADGTLGLAVCMEVLYYLEGPARAAAVDELARVLKPGGHLLVGTTLGDAEHYFTDASLTALVAPRFEPVARRLEYSRPYGRAMTALRRVSGRLPPGAARGLDALREAMPLARLGERAGRLLGARAVANGAFLFRRRDA